MVVQQFNTEAINNCCACRHRNRHRLRNCRFGCGYGCNRFIIVCYYTFIEYQSIKIIIIIIFVRFLSLWNLETTPGNNLESLVSCLDHFSPAERMFLAQIELTLNSFLLWATRENNFFIIAEVCSLRNFAETIRLPMKLTTRRRWWRRWRRPPATYSRFKFVSYQRVRITIDGMWKQPDVAANDALLRLFDGLRLTSGTTRNHCN